MLYCYPESFYNEMKLISEHNSSFPKMLDSTGFDIEGSYNGIDPLEHTISVAKNIIEKLHNTNSFNNINNNIAIRTFYRGRVDTLNAPTKDIYMSEIRFCTVWNNCLLITKPYSNFIEKKDGVEYYQIKTNDRFSISMISTSKIEDEDKLNIYLKQYINLDSEMYYDNNLSAKIPLFLLNRLV